jgi:hypothetical protein
MNPGPIDITIDQTELAELEERLGGLANRLPAILRKSVNKTAAHLRTSMRAQLAQALSMPQTRVKNRFWVNPARGHIAISESKAGRVGWPLAAFPYRQTRSGVRVQFAGARDYPRAFVARMPSGHIGIFRRHGINFTAARPKHQSPRPKIRRSNMQSDTRRKGRLPIDELRTESASALLIRFGLMPPIISAGGDYLRAQIQDDIQATLDKAALKASQEAGAE